MITPFVKYVLQSMVGGVTGEGMVLVQQHATMVYI